MSCNTDAVSAYQSGNINLIKDLYQASPEAFDTLINDGFLLETNLSLEIIKWIEAFGCDITKSSFAEYAALHGHSDAVDWLASRGASLDRVCAGAAKGGFYTVSDLAQLCDKYPGISVKGVCLGAACRNDVEMFVWGYERGDDITLRVWGKAAEHDSRDIIQWMLVNNCSLIFVGGMEEACALKSDILIHKKPVTALKWFPDTQKLEEVVIPYSDSLREIFSNTKMNIVSLDDKFLMLDHPPNSV